MAGPLHLDAHLGDSYLRLTALARRLIPGKLRPTVDEDDVVQEGFLRILRAWRKFARLDEGARARYARQVVRRIVLNLLRRSYHEECHIEVSAAIGALESSRGRLFEDEFVKKILDCAERLPVSQRDALNAVYVAGLLPKEAARNLGISRNALDQRMHNGMKRLRRQLQFSRVH